MEDMYSKILWEGYGIKNHNTTRVRTGFICKTDKGVIELKKARVRKRNLLFAHDVKEHLYKNGFKRLNRFFVTKDNMPFYEKDETLYVLEELLPKETLAETTIEDFLQGIKVLGNLHKLGKGLETKYATWDEGKLERTFQKRTNELGKVRGRIQKEGRYDNIDRLVMGAYEKCMNQCLQATEFLSNANYNNLFEKAKRDNAFCHSNYKGDSVHKDDNNNLYIGGFEYVKSDFPVIDLCNYLKRFLRKAGGNKDDILNLMEAYHKENPLSKEETLLLKALSIYPEKFLKVINEHYNKRRCCLSSAMEERLASVIKDEDESISLLSYLD